MSRLEELIAEHCPDGVEYVKLGDVFDMKNGYTPSRKNKSYWTDGTIPWFTLKDIRGNGNILNDSIEHVHESGVKGDLIPANSLILSNSATVGVHALIEVDFICNQRFTCFTDNGKYDVNMKFMYYYFEIVGGLAIDNTYTSSFPSISSRWLRNLTIPLPPIEVQNEIARILDTFTELTQELTQERELREKQYAYYRDTLLTFGDDVEVKKLGDVTIWDKRFNGGKGLQNETITSYHHVSAKKLKELDDTDGDIRLLSTGQYVGNTSRDVAQDYINNGEVFTIPTGGTANIKYHNGEFVDSGNILGESYDASKVSTKFLWYWLINNNHKVQSLFRGSAVQHPDMLSILRLEIPIPPIEVQNEIVEKLDRFNTLANDINHGLPKEIELRTKQYEYYRDQLLTFKEVTA